MVPCLRNDYNMVYFQMVQEESKMMIVWGRLLIYWLDLQEIIKFFGRLYLIDFLPMYYQQYFSEIIKDRAISRKYPIIL